MNILFIFFYLLFLFLSLVFFPSLSFYISVMSLLFFPLFKGGLNYKLLYFSIVPIILVSLIINTMSLSQLNYMGDDFVIYFNNYLDFLNGGFSTEYFSFSLGEISIPFLNYFFSVIIGEPLPYMVKLSYIIVIIFLFMCLITKVSRFYNLSYKDKCIFTSMMVVFFKLSFTFFLLRQGISSIFILLGCFSIKDYRRYFYWIIAVSFHLSALIIAPIIYFLLFEKREHLKKLYILGVLFVGFSLVFFNNLFAFNDVILNKFSTFNDSIKDTSLINAFFVNFSAFIYLFPLLFFCYFYKSKFNDIKTNLLCIFITFISFSFVIGLPGRILMPMLSIMMGFFYFYFYLKTRSKYIISFVSFVFLIFNIRWLFFDPSFYYRYPLLSEEPLYYINSFFDVGHRLNRYELPMSIERK